MYNHRIFFSLFSLILLFSCINMDKETRMFVITTTGNVKGLLNPVKTKYDVRGGLARKATIINNYKKEGIKPIILDAGNLFTDSCDINTIIKCYNKIGYNVLNVGAKDLSTSFNLKLLEKSAEFSFVSSNIVYTESQEPVFKEYVIIKRNGFRIAIIGLTSSSYKLKAKKYKIIEPTLSGRKILQKVKNLSDYQVILFDGNYKNAEKIQNELLEADFIFVSGDITPPRKNHKQKDGAFIQRVGDLGQFIISTKTIIDNEDSSLIDISVLVERKRFIEEKLFLTTGNRSNKQLEQLFGENYDFPKKINHMQSELIKTKKQLLNFTNTVEFTIIQLASIIQDENEITQIINTASNKLK